MKPQDIEPGKSYACKYTDLTGTKCLALIVQRDPENELLILRDVDTAIEMIVPYSAVEDVDTVEWTT